MSDPLCVCVDSWKLTRDVVRGEKGAQSLWKASHFPCQATQYHRGTLQLQSSRRYNQSREPFTCCRVAVRKEAGWLFRENLHGLCQQFTSTCYLRCFMPLCSVNSYFTASSACSKHAAENIYYNFYILVHFLCPFLSLECKTPY